MGIVKGIGKGFYHAARWFDIFVNYTVGKLKLWGSSGGGKGETISSTMGAEEAENLYNLWKSGKPLASISEDDIQDSVLEHPLEEFSSDLCNIFQKYHALQSIDWDKEADLTRKYPGIKDVVDNYLMAKGVN